MEVIKIYNKYKRIKTKDEIFEEMLRNALKEGNDKENEVSKRNDKKVRNYKFKLKQENDKK